MNRGSLYGLSSGRKFDCICFSNHYTSSSHMLGCVPHHPAPSSSPAVCILVCTVPWGISCLPTPQKHFSPTLYGELSAPVKENENTMDTSGCGQVRWGVLTLEMPGYSMATRRLLQPHSVRKRPGATISGERAQLLLLLGKGEWGRDGVDYSRDPHKIYERKSAGAGVSEASGGCGGGRAGQGSAARVNLGKCTSVVHLGLCTRPGAQ